MVRVETANDLLPFEEDPFDPCYECRGLGDDYVITEDGELEDWCPNCPYYRGGNDGEG